jgi:hypothetical protein
MRREIAENCPSAPGWQCRRWEAIPTDRALVPRLQQIAIFGLHQGTLAAPNLPQSALRTRSTMANRNGPLLPSHELNRPDWSPDHHPTIREAPGVVMVTSCGCLGEGDACDKCVGRNVLPRRVGRLALNFAFHAAGAAPAWLIMEIALP